MLFRKSHEDRASKPTQKPSSPPPAKNLSEEVIHDPSAPVTIEDLMVSWADEAVREFADRGGFDDLPGKGKPLDIPSGDPLQSILKNANFVPPWLELQHKIRDRIGQLIEVADVTSGTEFDQELAEINEMIYKYNQKVPLPMMQKMKITRETMLHQYSKWI